MISKIKKKIGEMFGKKDLNVPKKDLTVKEAQNKDVQKEEVKREIEVKVDRKKEEHIKSVENRRRDGERTKSNVKDRSTRVRQDQNSRRKDSVEGQRRYSDSKSGGKSYNKRDNNSKKNYSDRKSGENFKRVQKEEKLSNWIEEGLRGITEGGTLQYEGHSIEIVKKNTLGFQVKMSDSKEIKITFDELVTKLKGLKGANDMEENLSSEDNDKTIVIRGIFQKH